jgi:hypothetical protein
MQLTLGYLSYITERNKLKRFLDFSKSLDSLNNIKSKKVEFISIDNNSTLEAKEALLSSKLFSKNYHFSKNFFDVALFYTTVWHAKKHNRDYVCFLYDDFIVYDDAFDDVIEFMEKNSDVHCTRITEYDFDNKHLYDSDVTSKSINPDSIRHYNFVTGKKLSWSPLQTVGKHRFIKNNWHYTSRPCVWRTDFLFSVLEKQEKESNVLQGFENWAMKAFQNELLVTGVLDKGMVKTTPVVNSARGIEVHPSSEYNIKICLGDLKKYFELST